MLTIAKNMKILTKKCHSQELMLTTKIRQFIKLQKFKYPLPEVLISEQDYLKCIREKTTILQYIPQSTLTAIYSCLKNDRVHWQSMPAGWISKDWLYEGVKEQQFYIFSAGGAWGDGKVYLRINDFPEEPLYTVVYDDIELLHVSDFGKKWSSDQSTPSNK